MRIEPKDITDLRRQAKAISKLTGEKHTAALNAIAVTKGYKDWAALLRDKQPVQT